MASVHAPIFPFRSGSMFVLYEGHLSSDTEIEIISNRGRDKHTIQLKAGDVHGVYGSAEGWIDDLSIVFTGNASTNGSLKIGLYCGSSLNEEDLKWYRMLSKRK